MKGGVRLEIMKVDWALCWGKSRSTKPCLFRVKWLQPAMKGTSGVRRVRLAWFQNVIGSSSVLCNEWLFMCASIFWFVDSLVADRSLVAAWMLHGACFVGKSRSTKPCLFRVKWLQPAMKGTSMYLGCAAGAAWIVSTRNRFLLCVLQRVVVHVCITLIRLLTLWLRIAVKWLHECCMGLLLGEKPEQETLSFFV